MLRFIKHNLTGIDGVEIYPLISLFIFTVFFTVVIFMVIRMKRNEVVELSEIPLEDGTKQDQKMHPESVG